MYYLLSDLVYNWLLVCAIRQNFDVIVYLRTFVCIEIVISKGWVATLNSEGLFMRSETKNVFHIACKRTVRWNRALLKSEEFFYWGGKDASLVFQQPWLGVQDFSDPCCYFSQRQGLMIQQDLHCFPFAIFEFWCLALEYGQLLEKGNLITCNRVCMQA